MIHLNQREYDTERTKYLESSGLRVIRFNNNDIENRIKWVLDKINLYLNKLPPSRPSPKGEGGKQNKHFPLGGNKKGGKMNKFIEDWKLQYKFKKRRNVQCLKI